MQITQEFQVSRPIEAVWSFFQDVPAVAQCLPGAQLGEDRGDGTYSGTVTAKLGPMAPRFEGEATVSADPSTYSGHLEGKGVDRSGGSRGQVKVDYRLSESANGTQVSIDAEMSLSGAVAQFGRTGLINEMSSRLIGEFIECLEAKLAAPTEEEAATVQAGQVRGFSLFFSSLWAWIKGLFRRSR